MVISDRGRGYKRHTLYSRRRHGRAHRNRGRRSKPVYFIRYTLYFRRGHGRGSKPVCIITVDAPARLSILHIVYTEYTADPPARLSWRNKAAWPMERTCADNIAQVALVLLL